MRRAINNPYPADDYRCFACSPSNPIGLKLTFEEDEKYVYASWKADENFQGYNNVIHGGIITTLLDETGAWYISVKNGTAGVTKTINVEFLKPLYLSKGDVSIRASLIDLKENIASIECELFDSSGVLCAKSLAQFFLYPTDVAVRRFNYPGKDSF